LVALEQLRYVRIATRDLAGAADFAQRILGLEPVRRDDSSAAFRSDERGHTLVFATGSEAVNCVGFEVRYQAALDEALEVVSGAGVASGRGTERDCAARDCKAMVWFDDHSGNRIELVTRPLNSGWRYFPSRDAGIKSFTGVLLRTKDSAADEALWTELFGARVSDWAGDTVYLAIDDAHHRLALFPSRSGGILGVEFAVEDVNLLMRNWYYLQHSQIPVVHGPGRRPASEQLFVTFKGPEDVLFSFVAEGVTGSKDRRPRQFPAGAAGLCSWGSENKVPEFGGVGAGRDQRS
jgi:2,3-dihydroxy-p-cumate/2,3-dihydroxybenzoate 3,4-dioxygenase